jgi:hypothetical protein
MMRRGLLLTMTEPPAAMDEEFNAWLIELAWREPAGLPSGSPGALLRPHRAYGA